MKAHLAGWGGAGMQQPETRLPRGRPRDLWGQRPERYGDTRSDLGGRYWNRTSDLLGVNEALSR